MNYPLIVLEWRDVMSLETALVYPEDLFDIQPVNAFLAGFLVREDKENYWIAKEVWATGQCKYIHVMPKKYVIKRTSYPNQGGEKKK